MSKYLLACALVACSSGREDAPAVANVPRPVPVDAAPLPPVQLAWEPGEIGDLVAKAPGHELHITVNCCGVAGVASVWADKPSRDWHVRVGATDIAELSSAPTEVDVHDYLADLPLDAIIDRDQYGNYPNAHAALAIPVRVVFEGHAPAETTVPDRTFVSTVENLFRGLAAKPIVFAGEPPAGKPVVVAAYFSEHASHVVILGSRGKHVRDVDWVALGVDHASGRTIDCDYAPMNMPTVVSTQTVQIDDTELTVYDRRTGAKVASKAFPGRTYCPEFGGDHAKPDHDAMRAWIKQTLRAHK